VATLNAVVARAAALAALLTVVLPASAAAAFPGTRLLPISRAAGGGPPNGASRNPVISQDKRFGRLVAFESDATDIAGGAGSGTNVFVVRRDRPYGENGTPWSAGRTVLASVGIGGQPANGPSTAPALDGTSRVSPHCVAFVSAASNLVRGDTNGRPDAFVRDLRTGVTRRVSVDSRGRQSSGTVSEVAIDGLCRRVAFVSDADDLALTRTRNRSWRSAVTRPNPAGRRQLYLHAMRGPTGIDRALAGLTLLASASDGGVPGSGESHGLAFSTNARALTFTSEAANLGGEDRNGRPDIYQRTMARAYLPRRGGRRAQRLRMHTRLVSASHGRAGAGASESPASNVDGSVVAFATTAPELVGRGANGHPQVVQAVLDRDGVRTRPASGTARGAAGNGPSGSPSLTAGGSWVVFQSSASDVGVTTTRGPDANGGQDALLFTQPSGERWILGQHGSSASTANPMTSAHGNYVVFERGGQVHLLYVGPK